MSVYYPRCYAVLQCVFDGFSGPDSDLTIFTVEPKKATVSINGYFEADTFSLVFDANQFPITPELVRAAAVTIYMYNETSGEIGTNLRTQRENALIHGLVDEISLLYNDEERTVSMEGRDLTALLIDSSWDPNKSGSRGKIEDKGSLSKTVEALIKEASIPGVFALGQANTEPSGAKRKDYMSVSLETKIINEKTGERYDPPIVHDISTKKITGKNKKKTRKVKNKNNFWDVIYDLVISHGLITFVRGTEVVITEPRIQMKNDRAAYNFQYGRNLSEFAIERHLGKEMVPRVIVSGYDPSTKKAIRVTYPQKKNVATTGIGTKKDEFVVVNAERGVTNPDVYLDMARMYYDNIAGRQQRITIRTRDLTDLDGNNLLYIMAGTPIAILFNPLDKHDMKVLTMTEREQRLLSMGYDPKLARTIAEYYNVVSLYSGESFYVREATYEYDKDDGITVEIEASSYVYVGRDQHTEDGSNPVGPNSPESDFVEVVQGAIGKSDE